MTEKPLHEKKIKEIFEPLKRKFFGHGGDARDGAIDACKEKSKEWAIAKNNHCKCQNKRF